MSRPASGLPPGQAKLAWTRTVGLPHRPREVRAIGKTALQPDRADLQVGVDEQPPGPLLAQPQAISGRAQADVALEAPLQLPAAQADEAEAAGMLRCALCMAEQRRLITFVADKGALVSHMVGAHQARSSYHKWLWCSPGQPADRAEHTVCLVCRTSFATRRQAHDHLRYRAPRCKRAADTGVCPPITDEELMEQLAARAAFVRSSRARGAGW